MYEDHEIWNLDGKFVDYTVVENSVFCRLQRTSIMLQKSGCQNTNTSEKQLCSKKLGNNGMGNNKVK
jgi:hypothetical protein